MGRLITRDNLDMKADWYFEDAYFSSEARRYIYTWPSPQFSHCVAMNHDELYRENARQIAIRMWIERSTDLVIMDEIEHNYRKYYHLDMTWDHSYEITNRWVRFHFTDEHGATMFALTFSEWVKPITLHHPKYPDDEEWCNAPVGSKEREEILRRTLK